MLWRRFSKGSGLVLTGFAAGLVLMLALGAAEEGTAARKEILQENAFGDLRIFTQPFTGRSDTKETMVISKGDIPIVLLYRNDSNEVDRLAIANRQGAVALVRLTKSGILDLVLHGNEVHDGLSMPVLTMDASDKPGV